MIPEKPIVVAPMPTPFTADDEVDYGAIERNTEKWLATPLNGFVLNSENGEESFLSESERLAIVEQVAVVARGEKLIVGGIDSPSVADTLRTGWASASVNRRRRGLRDARRAWWIGANAGGDSHASASTRG